MEMLSAVRLAESDPQREQETRDLSWTPVFFRAGLMEAFASWVRVPPHSWGAFQGKHIAPANAFPPELL